MMARVTGEYYKLTDRDGVIKTYDKYTNDMFYDAMLHAGTHRKSVAIKRVTTWVAGHAEFEADVIAQLMAKAEKREDGYHGETVTGTYNLDIPHFATCVELSRYSPVNGWVLPEAIEV